MKKVVNTKRIESASIYLQLRRPGLLTIVLCVVLGLGVSNQLASLASAQDAPASEPEPKSETTQEPATQEPATQEPATQEPAAQEPAAESEEATATDESLESLLEQWKTLEAEMIAIEQKMLETDKPDESAPLRSDYIVKNDSANLLVGKIEAAALARLAAGKSNKELLELLTGIVINHADFERDLAALEIGQKLIDVGIEKNYLDTAATMERLSPSAKEVLRELAIRSAEATTNDLPRVKLVTSKGDIVLELFENEAPETVGNFVSLVEADYYNGLAFHRVLENFMAQGGDPNGDGSGGPGYTIYCECYKSDFRRHFTGSLSMAKTPSRDSGGSQFFITFVRSPSVIDLDGKHTVFGRVISGMEVVNSLQRIDPEDRSGQAKPEADKIITAEVLRKRDHEYKPNKTGGG